jgi:hypothetical protein
MNDSLKGIAMTDATTNRPIRVSADGTAGPYILVPVSQLDDIVALLRQAGFVFWVDENAISMDGKPAIAVVNLGRGTDAVRVQAILDSAR